MPTDSVDSIDNLRNYSGPADVVFVKGYRIPGDGGGGAFLLDPTSSELVDNGIVIQPLPPLRGRWKRLFDGWVNVKWFGAKGDTQYVLDGKIMARSTTLTSDRGLFARNDVGKEISVAGAGPGGEPLLTTIESFLGARQVKLRVWASTTVGQADEQVNVTWGRMIPSQFKTP